MNAKYLQEKDIREAVKNSSRNNNYFSYRPKDFIVYKLDNLWYVNFTYMEEIGYELRIKNRGNDKEIVLRNFVQLGSVEACLRRLGVSEFKVIINL